MCNWHNLKLFLLFKCIYYHRSEMIVHLYATFHLDNLVLICSDRLWCGKSFLCIIHYLYILCGRMSLISFDIFSLVNLYFCRAIPLIRGSGLVPGESLRISMVQGIIWRLPHANLLPYVFYWTLVLNPLTLSNWIF